jgi:hypothetical protein
MAIQAHSSQENGFPDFERSAMLQPLMQTHSEFRLDILVDDPQDLGRLLDQAVQRLIPAALERRQGILVTQVFPDKYTVEVHQDVLCGVVQERRIDPNAHKSQLQTNSMT